MPAAPGPGGLVPPDGAKPYPEHKVPGSSVRDVDRVARLDGRTWLVAVRPVAGPWYRTARRVAFTHATVQRLRESRVNEVVIRRGARAVSLPVAWIGGWQS